MKKNTFKYGDKSVEYSYPDGLEGEMGNQLNEIWLGETYKKGLRKKDAVYVDLGANIGMAANYFLPYAKEIHCIEPNPEIYKALVENTKNHKNIKTYNMAIANMTGFNYMYSNSGGSLPQTFFPFGSAVNSIKVNTMGMNDFLEKSNIDHVDVLKIDVEEAEYIIFPSDQFALAADKIDFIIGESHFQPNGGFPDLIPKMLGEYGFKTTFLTEQNENYKRKFTYREILTGKSKYWEVAYNTIFIAEK